MSMEVTGQNEQQSEMCPGVGTHFIADDVERGERCLQQARHAILYKYNAALRKINVEVWLELRSAILINSVYDI
jgi:hypothetical protein